MNRLWPMVLPELRQLSADQWENALERARDTPLDTLELLGMAAAMVLVTALTRYTLPDLSSASRLAAGLLNFAVAIPLLVATLGPFHLRRLRRGLREHLKRRQYP